MVEGEQFEQKEVVVMSEKVRQLQSLYKSVEEAGSHAFLNELRALNASLINKWEEFETSLAAHMSNLDLSLKFQETLFEVIIIMTSIHLNTSKPHLLADIDVEIIPSFSFLMNPLGQQLVSEEPVVSQLHGGERRCV